jgi:hypothetical protein
MATTRGRLQGQGGSRSSRRRLNQAQERIAANQLFAEGFTGVLPQANPPQPAPQNADGAEANPANPAANNNPPPPNNNQPAPPAANNAAAAIPPRAPRQARSLKDTYRPHYLKFM